MVQPILTLTMSKGFPKHKVTKEISNNYEVTA